MYVWVCMYVFYKVLQSHCGLNAIHPVQLIRKHRMSLRVCISSCVELETLMIMIAGDSKQAKTMKLIIRTVDISHGKLPHQTL
jgi:hypothetical protein